MDNRSVAHEWAHGKQAKGSNFFTDTDLYSGQILYSYGRHFIVGYRYLIDPDKPVFLLNSEKYSPSTQRHQSYARQAAYGDYIFHVKHPNAALAQVDRSFRRTPSRLTVAHSNRLHRENYQHMVDMARSLYAEALKRRAGSMIQFSELNEANYWIAEANKYSNFFKLRYKNKPEFVLNQRTLKRYKETQRKKKEAKARKERTLLRAWLNNEVDRLPSGNFELAFRIVERKMKPYDNKHKVFSVDRGLQTVTCLDSTLGIRDIPYDVVKCTIHWAKQCKETGVAMNRADIETVNRAMKTYAIEQDVRLAWQLTAIRGDGTIIFGCHRVPLRMALLLEKKVKEMRGVTTA